MTDYNRSNPMTQNRSNMEYVLDMMSSQDNSGQSQEQIDQLKAQLGQDMKSKMMQNMFQYGANSSQSQG
jgi:hypothetical protein